MSNFIQLIAGFGLVGVIVVLVLQFRGSMRTTNVDKQRLLSERVGERCCLVVQSRLSGRVGVFVELTCMIVRVGDYGVDVRSRTGDEYVPFTRLATLRTLEGEVIAQWMPHVQEGVYRR